jgi:hypothetical protein
MKVPRTLPRNGVHGVTIPGTGEPFVDDLGMRRPKWSPEACSRDGLCLGCTDWDRIRPQDSRMVIPCT